MHAGVVNTMERISDRQLRMFRGTFGLLLLAEAMVFVTVFGLRFVFAGRVVPDGVNWTLGIGITVLLAISWWPASSALRAARSGRSREAAPWLLATFGLGTAALALIVVDWATIGVPPASRFGGTYLLGTGYHALHIVAGLVTALALAVSARRGRFSSENYWVVEAGVWLWWFVIASWLALFVVFYLA